jgi:hypothetical protein
MEFERGKGKAKRNVPKKMENQRMISLALREEV